jgi:CorA-like Mg2+ transporter protein
VLIAQRSLYIRGGPTGMRAPLTRRRSDTLRWHDACQLFGPTGLVASIWGMNVGGIPFSGSQNGFWVVAGLIAAVFTSVALVLF